MKKKKTFRQMFNESIFAKGEFYIKLSITIFFIVLYAILFVACDGFIYFEQSKYTGDFRYNQFQVHMINVGNGDAILIRLPGKKTMMIDTGESKYYNELSSYLRQYQYMEKSSTIDYLVMTHPDSDHIGNAKKIIENFNVKTIYRPKIYSLFEQENELTSEGYVVSDSIPYNEAIEQAYKKNCTMIFSAKGLSIQLENCLIEFLSPKLDVYEEDNNYSAVIMISYLNKKFLFMGDAETIIENTLIQDYGDYLKADVLKVGHHGSKTSSSQAFLEVVQPNIALLSVNDSSKYLPNDEIVDRLYNNNAKVFSTSKYNNFALAVVDGEILFKQSSKPENYLVYILAAFLIIIFIVWENPFKNLKKNIKEINNE